MEQATVPSETSIRRSKRGRVLEQEEGAEPSKSTGSPDELFNDDDDFVPKTKRKRGAAARAAGWSDNHPLIGSIFTDIQSWIELFSEIKSCRIGYLIWFCRLILYIT